MITSHRTLLAIISCFLITFTFASDSKDGALSEPGTIESDHSNKLFDYFDTAKEGDIKFTYWTFLRGPEGLQVPYLKGKIEITDKEESYDNSYSAKDALWRPTLWSAGKEIRIAFEFGIPGQELINREQIRFVAHFEDDGGTLKGKWNDKIQFVKDYNATLKSVDPEFHHMVYLFCRTKEADTAFDTLSGKSGYKITDSAFNFEKKTVMLEFERPMDVSEDITLFMQFVTQYRLWITWGVFGPDQDSEPKSSV